MPIRPEEKARYPKDWPAISQSILRRADNKCEECGVKNGALGGRLDGRFLSALPLGERNLRLKWPEPGTWAFCGEGDVTAKCRIIRIVLTVAHLDHTPENCCPANLKALCQRCHLRYDAAHHRRNSDATRRSRRAVGDLFAKSPLEGV